MAEDSNRHFKIDALLGLPAIQALNLIPAIKQVSADSSCEEVLSHYKDTFGGLVKCNKIGSLQLKKDTVPKATAPHCVPAHLRSKLKAELDRLVIEEIITPDDCSSEWLSPPIIVNKPNGSIRFCLDSQYLNTQLVDPQDKKAAQSFLGFVGYLSKFIDNLSELAESMRKVCKKKASNSCGKDPKLMQL